MLSWIVEQGVIRELRHDGQNFIRPWGIETADSSGFFSLESGIGYRHVRLSSSFIATERRVTGELEVQMPEGHWRLATEDCIADGATLHRKATLTAVRPSVLMDFVMRFRFRRAFFNRSEIAGQLLTHRASDVYHQHPVRSASLAGSQLSVHISIEESRCTPSFSPYLYMRDHADEWIVHARMLPLNACKEVIKICNGWSGTRALPQWLSRPLLALPGCRERLWYRNERRPYPALLRRVLNLNAFPMGLLHAGESLHWRVRMELK